MNLILVKSNNLEEYWLKTRVLIEAACTRSFGKFHVIDVLKELMSGNMNLWVAEDKEVKGLAITQIVKYPRLKVCKVICCTGKGRKDWTHLLLDIEKWAKKQGCSEMEPECRLGWARVLKGLGYERGHIILRKVIA